LGVNSKTVGVNSITLGVNSKTLGVNSKTLRAPNPPSFSRNIIFELKGVMNFV